MIIAMWILIGFLIVSNVYLLWAHFQNMKTLSSIVFFESKANEAFLNIFKRIAVSEEERKKFEEVENEIKEMRGE